MSERRVRLLYKTTCRACGDDVPAGTTTWWDDDRRQATCASCLTELEEHAEPHHHVVRMRLARPIARRPARSGPPRRAVAGA